MRLSAVILAAGESTRFKSSIPKVLHPLAGKPMVLYGVDTAAELGAGRPVLVIGHRQEQVQQVVGDAARYVVQSERMGTGHAVLQARELLEGSCDAVLVCYADMPLLTATTLRRLVEAHMQADGPVTMLALRAENPRGFGRVVRDGSGQVLAVVEESECTAEQLAIRELNSGVYCFDATWLWEHLPELKPSSKGEYYLTDTVGMAVSEGSKVQALVTEDEAECLGINTRVHLAEAERIVWHRTNRRWMLDGVSMVDPESIYIEAGVDIGEDTVLYPNTYLQGQTRIGKACRIGPSVLLMNAHVGDGCRIGFAVAEDIAVQDGDVVGPFVHLKRPE